MVFSIVRGFIDRGLDIQTLQIWLGYMHCTCHCWVQLCQVNGSDDGSTKNWLWLLQKSVSLKGISWNCFLPLALQHCKQLKSICWIIWWRMSVILESVTVSDTSAFDLCNIHINREYQGSRRGLATRMQDAVVLIKRQQRGEQHTMGIKVVSSLQSVVRRRSSMYRKERVWLLHPIRTAYLDEFVRYVAIAGIENERS